MINARRHLRRSDFATPNFVPRRRALFDTHARQTLYGLRMAMICDLQWQLYANSLFKLFFILLAHLNSVLLFQK